MDRQQLVDGLDFHDHRVLDHQIHAVSAVQLDAFVLDRQVNLPFETEAQLTQLIAEAFLVSRLQQARAQVPMDLDRRADDHLRSVNLDSSRSGLAF